MIVKYSAGVVQFGMSSNFSLAFTGKTQQRRVHVQEKVSDGNKEAVIGFGENGLQTAEPKQVEGPLVIPRLENTYRYKQTPG